MGKNKAAGVPAPCLWGRDSQRTGLEAKRRNEGLPRTDRQTHTHRYPSLGLFSLQGGSVFTKALKLLNKMVPPLLEGAWGSLGCGAWRDRHGQSRTKGAWRVLMGAYTPLYSLFPPWSSQDPEQPHLTLCPA